MPVIVKKNMSESPHETKIQFYEALEALATEIKSIQEEIDDITKKLDADSDAETPILSSAERTDLRKQRFELISAREELKAKQKRIEQELSKGIT